MLLIAVHELVDLGAAGSLQWQFRNHPAAMRAIKRQYPELAGRAEALVREAHDLRDTFFSRWHGPEPERGQAKGTIVVAGNEFSVAPSGAVLMNGKATQLRINSEHHCWVVARLGDPSWRLRRHYVAQGGKKMALLDAALILTERVAKQVRFEPPRATPDKPRRSNRRVPLSTATSPDAAPS